MTITAIDAAGPGLSSGVPLFTNPRRDLVLAAVTRDPLLDQRPGSGAHLL